MTNIDYYRQILGNFLDSLRSVGASYSEKELHPKTIEKIDNVKSLFKIIQQKKMNYQIAMNKLSEKCDWDLEQLLQDILAFPRVIPRVKKLNGDLHYVFKAPPLPPPIAKHIKQELIQLASHIQDSEKREELLLLIHEERSILYLTSELSISSDLNNQDRKRAVELFAYFY